MVCASVLLARVDVRLHNWVGHQCNSTGMTTLVTTFIIPMDLNTFICKMGRDITVFAELIGEEGNCRNFLTGLKKHAIRQSSLLWNSDLEQWLDYWLPTDANCQGVYKCRNGRLLTY